METTIGNLDYSKKKKKKRIKEKRKYVQVRWHHNPVLLSLDVNEYCTVNNDY